MKSHVMLLLAMIASVPTYGKSVNPEFERAHIKGAETKMVIRAVDDEKHPVGLASVHVLMGMNFRLKSYDIDGVTDTNGIFVVNGTTTGNEIEITVRKAGHYEAFKKLCFIGMGHEYDVKNGKWQPWGMEITLPLRRVMKPANLISAAKSFYVPATNRWIGFDMAEKDWVFEGLYGKKSDFEVFVTWDGKVTAYSELLKIDVRFTGKGEGFYMADATENSSFASVYEADTNGVFNQKFSCQVFNDGHREMSGIKHGKLIVIRSRCEHDDNQSLLRANYSVLNWFGLHGSFSGKVEMPMSFVFNPTPNDTNLEPKQ